MKTFFVSSLLIFVVLAAACQQKAQIDTASQEAAVKAYKDMLDLWDTAHNARDVDRLVSFYLDDAYRMQQEEPAWIGHDEIRDGFKNNFDRFAAIEVDNVAQEVKICGDWAFVRGTTTWTSTLKGGEETKGTSKWMSVNKRQSDGSWKIQWDIWNSDKPLLRE